MKIYHLYTTYILPSGGLYATYHLLGEPETTIASCETSSSFHTSETKNRRFYASFSYQVIFTKLQNYYFLRGFSNFARQSPNAAPATTFDTVSSLRSPDTAIHGKSILDTSQNAAPATQMQNATLQSAAPATRKRHACIDTRPKYCACHATRENDLPPGDFEAPTSISCETYSALRTLKEMIVSHCVCTAHSTEINDATTTRPRHDQHEANTSRTPDRNYKREPFATHSGKITRYLISH